MKTINLFLIYVFTYMFFFFLLSLIGMLWNQSYSEVAGNANWFVFYSLFFGWWIALTPCIEYYSRNREYFKRHF
jgi:hypothetical protein